MTTNRRKRGTGCVTQRGPEYFIAIAPQHKRGERQFRVATGKTRSEAATALDAWLNGGGRIVRRDAAAEKRGRRNIQ